MATLCSLWYFIQLAVLGNDLADGLRQKLAASNFTRSTLRRALPSLNAGAELAATSPIDRSSNSTWTVSSRSIFKDGVLKYSIVKLVGQGAFGKVFLAHDEDNNEVAIKRIPKSKITDAIINEVRNQKQVHEGEEGPIPSVIQILEDFSTDDALYMVLDFFHGGELFDYIVKAHRLLEKRARSIFQQVIDGLALCHERGVAHRDLKPENILYDANRPPPPPYDQTQGTAKIIDFGLSADMQSADEIVETSAGKMLTIACGSPNYAAPELFRKGTKYAGPPVDIWAMGVVLFAMLCGRLPFDEEKNATLVQKISRGNYKFCSRISDTAKDLIQRMLVVDPGKRITIQEIRSHAFFGGQGGTCEGTRFPRLLTPCAAVKVPMYDKHSRSLIVYDTVYPRCYKTDSGYDISWELLMGAKNHPSDLRLKGDWGRGWKGAGFYAGVGETGKCFLTRKSTCIEDSQCRPGTLCVPWYSKQTKPGESPEFRCGNFGDIEDDVVDPATVIPSDLLSAQV